MAQATVPRAALGIAPEAAWDSWPPVGFSVWRTPPAPATALSARCVTAPTSVVCAFGLAPEREVIAQTTAAVRLAPPRATRAAATQAARTSASPPPQDGLCGFLASGQVLHEHLETTSTTWQPPRAAPVAETSVLGCEVPRTLVHPARELPGGRVAEAALVGTRVGSRMARGARGGDHAARRRAPRGGETAPRAT